MDLRQIKNLMKHFEESDVHKLEINEKEFTIKLEKEESKNFSTNPSNSIVTQTAVKTAVEERVEEVEKNNYIAVQAPLVGTYYEASSPDSEPFVKQGTYVNKGDVVCIIEAMKVMNEITAPVSGTVKEIHTVNGSMVQFNEVIMELEE